MSATSLRELLSGRKLSAMELSAVTSNGDLPKATHSTGGSIWQQQQPLNDSMDTMFQLDAIGQDETRAKDMVSCLTNTVQTNSSSLSGAGERLG